MTEQLTAADVLERAASKLEQPGAWVQGSFAKDKDGLPEDWDSPHAVCFCALGAIHAIIGPCLARVRAKNILAEMVGHVPYWNDAPVRTQAEVVAKLREAAALARAEAA